MPSPNIQTGSAEFDQSEWLQFGIPELEGHDIDTFELPSLLPLETLPSDMEAPSTQTLVQSLDANLWEPSPRPRSRRASTITVRRRSSAITNKAILSVTLEDPRGRKRSWDVDFDSVYEAWQNSLSAEQVSVFTQFQVATSTVESSTVPVDNHQPQGSQQFSRLSQLHPMPSPMLAPQPMIPLAQHLPHLSTYDSVADPISHLESAQQPLAPLQPHMAPILASDPMPVARRTNRRVSASTQILQRQGKRPIDVVDRLAAGTRPRPQSTPQGFHREGLGDRPSLPEDIAMFINPHHQPHNHGRVPDKRGNKDTTLANDYYYSISKLDGLELPRCNKTVSYSGVEFDAGLRFTGEEFLEYLHCASQRPNRQPILRIQIQPAQYNHRYIRAGQSFKCRFAGCPDKRGTILKGQARVCISEFEDHNGDWLNPFHNAGYVHLFCLEQQINFIELCETPSLTVVAETRSLAHEPPAKANIRLNNPMSLNDVERSVADEWLSDIGIRWDAFRSFYPDPTVRPTFELPQEDTLTYRLTKAHTDNNVLQNIQQKRKREGGGRLTAHLDEFVGDVGKQVAMQKRMRKQPPKEKPGADDSIQKTPSPKSKAQRRGGTPPLHQAMSDSEAQVRPAFSDLATNEYVQLPQGGYKPISSHCPLPKVQGLPPLPHLSEASHLVSDADMPTLDVDNLAPLPPASTSPPADALHQCRASTVAAAPCRRGRRHRPPPILIVRSPGVTKLRSSKVRGRTSSSNARLEAELLAYLADAETRGNSHLDEDDGGRIEEIG